MTMKKKILTTLSVVLILGLAALGILAYLQSEDSDVNVMTLGNVDIEQHEQQKAEDGSLEPFEQGKALLPGATISKIVSVKNVGTSPAYVRTLVAFETVAGNTFDYESNLDDGEFLCSILRDGVYYDVYEYVYDKVAAGTETAPSLTEVKLAESCTNEDMEALGGTYDILVLSQAVQTEGFDSATEALDAAFPKGENNENVPVWFDGDEFDKPENLVFVSNTKEFVDALTDIKTIAKTKIPGETGNKQYRVKANIVLTEDIKFNDSALFMYTDGNGAPLHFYGFEGTLNLNGHKIEVTEDALLNGKAYANAVLLIQYSDIEIIGDGDIVANNKSIPVYAWANCTVDIYGGNYVTNASERNESAVYVNNSSATVNVYGGTYTGSAYAFNTHDNLDNSTGIVLHEGVTFEKFLKNGTGDVIKSDINNNRIICADDCEIVEYEDNGVAMFKVVKK